MNTKTDVMKYSQQLAMLGQLKAKGLIDDREYDRVKQGLMRDYKVLSGLTA